MEQVNEFFLDANNMMNTGHEILVKTIDYCKEFFLWDNIALFQNIGIFIGILLILLMCFNSVVKSSDINKSHSSIPIFIKSILFFITIYLYKPLLLMSFNTWVKVMDTIQLTPSLPLHFYNDVELAMIESELYSIMVVAIMVVIGFNIICLTFNTLSLIVSIPDKILNNRHSWKESFNHSVSTIGGLSLIPILTLEGMNFITKFSNKIGVLAISIGIVIVLSNKISSMLVRMISFKIKTTTLIENPVVTYGEIDYGNNTNIDNSETYDYGYGNSSSYTGFNNGTIKENKEKPYTVR